MRPEEGRSGETAGLPHAGEHGGGDGAGAGGAVLEHGLDVGRVGGEFGAASAVGREEIPVMLEETSFEVAVAEAAGAQAVLEIGGDVGGRAEVEALDAEGFVGVGPGFGGRAAIHADGHEMFAVGR